MPRYHVVAVVALLGALAPVASLHAQRGGGMGGGMGPGMGGARDSASAAIMQVVHELVMNHDKLRRTVTNLPNGIRTLTESDDPAMVQKLQSHVAATGALVRDAKDPNLPMSTPALHGVLQNGKKISRSTQLTANGVVVVETSDDKSTVALLQAHAAEVTDLVNRGMVAMHEAMMKSGGKSAPPSEPKRDSSVVSSAMDHAAHHDPAFAALQDRGKRAMGVDQYTSTHQFEARADGGRIELQRDVDDSVGIAQIRSHLQGIQAAFAAGDFTTPAFVHMQTVPGTRVMAAKRAQITYTFRQLPRGGELRIVSKDAEAISAIHEFLAFQRTDHRTP